MNACMHTVSYSYITSTSRISLLLHKARRSSANNNDILRVLVI